MFDDVDDLFNDAAAENQQPPPPFLVAGAAAVTTAAALVANGNTSTVAVSERSVPAYQPPLRQRIAGFYDRHTRLTAKLKRLGDIPLKLDANQHSIYTVTGKVKTQVSRLKTLQSISQEKQDAYTRMSSSFAKRIMNKGGKRSRSLLQAQQEAEKARADQAKHEGDLEESRSLLAAQHKLQVDLERDLIEYSALSNELDTVDSVLFDGATPEFPQDDFAEWEVKVWTQVQIFMAAEANREKRARQMLKDATPILASVIKDIQTALQYCIDSGVASNTKYKNQLITNNTAVTTVRATQPLVLRAKTDSGKLFTTIAKARGSQMLVGRPPEFRLIELYLMPESKNPKAVDEKGLHKSLESSYAQAKALDSYLKREIATSLERQKKITAETAALQGTVKSARQHLRYVRRSIVETVMREDHGEELGSTPAGRAARSNTQTSIEQRTYALPLQDAANPMISTQLQENLRKEALTRLRKLIALPEPESDDDNLYPVIA